jgi:cytochrome c553
MAPTNPHLAGQHADYIALQLAAFKSGARPSPIMQGMAAGLTPEDMRSVGAYFEAQKPVEAFARDQALALRGQQVWRGGIKGINLPACAGCHGPAGHGNPAQNPRLAGQWPELSFGWLKAFANGERAHPVMGPVAAKLSEKDMKALAEFISGLR